MIPVYVTHIDSPSCFSVQLIKENTTQRLECLQNDMAAFFRSKEAEKYRIEEPMVGQVGRGRGLGGGGGYLKRSRMVQISASTNFLVAPSSDEL